MAIGEVANFLAYSFAPAILVTPLGAASVVISAVLSSYFLNERLNFSAKVGCMQCLLGSLIIVLHAPDGNKTETVAEFFDYATSTGFVLYFLLLASVLVYLIRVVAPKSGDKHPMVYISICSLIGSLLVVSTQGFGSAIVYSLANWDTGNQLTKGGFYLIALFVVVTILLQINYLNKALNLFSTAIVSPVYYVFFTLATIITSSMFFQGFPADDAVSTASIAVGFVIIVGGVSLLLEYNLEQSNLMTQGSLLNLSLTRLEYDDKDDILMNSFGRGRRSRRSTINREVMTSVFIPTDEVLHEVPSSAQLLPRA